MLNFFNPSVFLKRFLTSLCYARNDGTNNILFPDSYFSLFAIHHSPSSKTPTLHPSLFHQFLPGIAPSVYSIQLHAGYFP